MTVKLLTEHHLEFLSLKGGCTGSSESTLVKMSNCWKSHVMAQILVPAHIVMNSSIWLNTMNLRWLIVQIKGSLYSGLE